MFAANSFPFSWPYLFLSVIFILIIQLSEYQVKMEKRFQRNFEF